MIVGAIPAGVSVCGSVLLCDHLQHLQSHGPLVRGDLGEHEERTSIIHAVKVSQNFAWYGTFNFFENTGPELVQFWVVNSTKLKLMRRVSLTNYIFLTMISGGVSEIQPKLLHPYVLPCDQLWGSNRRQSSCRSCKKLQWRLARRGHPGGSTSVYWSQAARPTSAASPTAPDL